MKRIITIIIMTACVTVLMNSCQKKTPEIKEGVLMTIQASVVNPAGSKVLFEYTTDKTLKGYWGSNEAITVVSFGAGGITAVDKFESIGEAGRTKAEFSGIWHGNEDDKIICLYPPVDSYAGVSIYEGVTVGSPSIYMRDISTASKPLQHDDTGSVSDVDLMLGEVTISGDEAHVYLEHQIAVFRIEVTLRDLPYYLPPGSPYDQARVNSIRIKCVDPDEDYDEWSAMADAVFVKISCLEVTTGSYTGKPYAVEKGPLDYYLLDAGYNSSLSLMEGGPVEKTFFVPVRFDKSLEPGYELCLQFGGNYYSYEDESRVSTTVFPGCDKRKTIPGRLLLENGKIYGFKVTI